MNGIVRFRCISYCKCPWILPTILCREDHVIPICCELDGDAKDASNSSSLDPAGVTLGGKRCDAVKDRESSHVSWTVWWVRNAIPCMFVRGEQREF